MKRYRNGLLVFIIVGGLTAVGIAATSSEEEAILALERQWSDRFGKGDVDWIVAAHAPDAQQFPPNAPPVVGIQAVRAAWQSMSNTDGLSLSWQPTRAYISSSGDMAWDYGAGKLTNPDGETQDVKYVVIWHRIDGEWKVVMDMFSPNSD